MLTVGCSILRSTQRSAQWSLVCGRNQNESLDEYWKLLGRLSSYQAVGDFVAEKFVLQTARHGC